MSKKLIKVLKGDFAEDMIDVLNFVSVIEKNSVKIFNYMLENSHPLDNGNKLFVGSLNEIANACGTTTQTTSKFIKRLINSKEVTQIKKYAYQINTVKLIKIYDDGEERLESCIEGFTQLEMQTLQKQATTS